MIQRHSSDWYAALDAFIADRRDRVFAWGDNDCCTCAADWVKMVRGEDPMLQFRGLRDARAAARQVAALGGLRAAVSVAMGGGQAGSMAQAGDLALVPHGERASMGICVGAAIAVPGETGLVMVPITHAEVSWRV